MSTFPPVAHRNPRASDCFVPHPRYATAGMGGNNAAIEGSAGGTLQCDWRFNIRKLQARERQRAHSTKPNPPTKLWPQNANDASLKTWNNNYCRAEAEDRTITSTEHDEDWWRCACACAAFSFASDVFAVLQVEPKN